MAISNVYTIEDIVAKTFSQPCIFSSDEVASRSFGDMITSLHYAKHRGDYRLFRVGTFDHDNGFIVPTENPVFIVSGDSFAIANTESGDVDVEIS